LSNYERARQKYEDAAKELQQLLNERQNASERERLLIVFYQLHIHFGDLLLSKLEDPEGAYREYKEALNVRGLDPDLASYARTHDIAWALNKLADVSRDRGADQQALKLYSKAKDRLKEIGDHLWDDLRWPTTLAMVLTNIGVELEKHHQYDAAYRSFMKARDMASDLSKYQPHDIHVMAVLGWIEVSIGEMQLLEYVENHVGAVDIALTSLEAANTQQMKIVELRPERQDWKSGLCYTQELISDIKGGNFDKAIERIIRRQRNPTRRNHGVEQLEVRREESQPTETCPRHDL
jgi:tetratricopeptide (TPR) repeat protein